MINDAAGRPFITSLCHTWPVKFVAGDWDNESDKTAIESVTLTYDFFESVP